MQYDVRLTPQATRQIKETVQYIATVLMEPQTAWKWVDTLQREIQTLDFMPSRYALTEEEPWRTRGLHKMLVGNFFVYYRVDEETKIVWVVAVIYARRNQDACLRDDEVTPAD